MHIAVTTVVCKWELKCRNKGNVTAKKYFNFVCDLTWFKISLGYSLHT